MPNPLGPNNEVGVVIDNPDSAYGVPDSQSPRLYSETHGLTDDWDAGFFVTIADDEEITGAKNFSADKTMFDAVAIKTGEDIYVTHESFAGGADPTGATDSHDAIIAALDWWAGTPNHRGSFVVFPPSETGLTKYKTSTVDLDGYRYACFRGMGGAGARTPAAQIVGIGGDPLFIGTGGYGGGGSNTVFENFYFGGDTLTCFDLTEAAYTTWRRCTFAPDYDGSADNTGILLKSSFWQFYEECTFNAPGLNTSQPAMIWRGTLEIDRAVYLQFVRRCLFQYSGVAHQTHTPVVTTSGPLVFDDCWSEQFDNATGSLIDFSTTEAAAQSIIDLSVRRFQHFDPTGGSASPALIRVNANMHIKNIDLDGLGGVGNGSRGVVVMDAANNGLASNISYSNAGSAVPLATDFAGALVDIASPNVMWGGAVDGFELVSHGPGSSPIAPFRIRRHNEVFSRLESTGEGNLYRGYGSAAPTVFDGVHPGTPEGVVTSSPGGFCHDTTNGECYVKKTGTGNTGWKLVTHA